MPTNINIQGNFKIQGGLYVNYGTNNTYVWNGLGSNNNWSTDNNWNIQTFPRGFDYLIFAGSTRTAPFNDLTIDTPINGIEFASGAAAFQISGNRFVLNSGGIANNSSNTQTINNDIILGSNAGTVNCNTAAISLNGDISGSGSLTKIGAQTLSLSGNNSYTGNTFISAGNITIGNSNPFGTGIVNISVAGVIFTVDANSIPSTVVINNTLNFVSSSPDIIFDRSTTLNGPVNFTSGSVQLQGTLNGIVTFNNTISASINVSLFYPARTMIFNAPVILEGALSQGFQAESDGTYTFNTTGNKLNTLNGAGALFVCGVSNAFSQHRTFISLGRRSGSYGRINLNGTDQAFTGIRNRTTSFLDCSGCNIFNNTLTTSNLTLTGSNLTYTGSISGNINLIKLGTTTQILSGNTNLGVGPRYTGFTAISAGTLTVRALSSNPSNMVNFASFTNTTLTVSFTTPPIAGDSFILLPARTINLYPAVTLLNASGRTGTYNSTNSTLTIS